MLDPRQTTTKSRWVCDHCQVAVFDSYNATVEHEKICFANKNRIIPNLGHSRPLLLNQHENKNEYQGTEPEDAIIISDDKTDDEQKVWVCDKCKDAEFSTFEEAVEHEKRCTGTKSKIPSPITNNETPALIDLSSKVFLCDVCKIAKFSTYEEADEHEKYCKGADMGEDRNTMGPALMSSTSEVINQASHKSPEKNLKPTDNGGSVLIDLISPEREGSSEEEVDKSSTEDQIPSQKKSENGIDQSLESSESIPKTVLTSSTVSRDISKTFEEPKTVSKDSLVTSQTNTLSENTSSSIGTACSKATPNLLPNLSNSSEKRIIHPTPPTEQGKESIPKTALTSSTVSRDTSKTFEEPKTVSKGSLLATQTNALSEKTSSSTVTDRSNMPSPTLLANLSNSSEKRIIHPTPETEKSKEISSSLGQNVSQTAMNKEKSLSSHDGQKNLNENPLDNTKMRQNLLSNNNIMSQPHNDNQKIMNMQSSIAQLQQIMKSYPTSGQVINQSTFPKKIFSQPDKLILEPLICGKHDHGTDSLPSLPPYYFTILNSIDLVEHVPSRKVNFRCTYCKQSLPSQMSIKKMGEELPGFVQHHLLFVCKHAPPATKLILKTYEGDREIKKLSFGYFCKRFCEENGIQEKVDSVSCNLVVIPKNEWKSISRYTRRFGMATKSISITIPIRKPPKPTSTHSTKKMLMMHSSIPVPRSAVRPTTASKPRPPVVVRSPRFPIRFPQVENLFQRLSSFNQIALDQIEFLLTERFDGYARVSIVCKHCGSMSKLTQSDQWQRSVYAMSYSHISKSCRSMPVSVRKVITRFQKEKKGGNTIGLKQYCVSVGNYYDFNQIDSNVTVRYEESSSPNDSAIVAPLIGNKTSYEEVKSRRKRPAADIEQDVKRFKETNEVKKMNDGLIPYKKNTFLTPIGGIPLTCRFTKKEIQSLDRSDAALLENLEFYTKSQHVYLRCSNCSSTPFSGSGQILSSIETIHIDIMKNIAHLKRCTCTPKEVQDILPRHDADLTKTTNVLKEYCKYIVQLYGLKDLPPKPGVIWGQSSYCLKEYDASEPAEIRKLEESEIDDPFTDRKKLIHTVPTHDLMLRTDEVNKERQQQQMFLPATVFNVPQVLTDYDYIYMRQLEFITIKTDKISTSSPDKSVSSSSSSSLSMPPPPAITKPRIGIRCRHCKSVKPITDINTFCNVDVFNLPTHFHKNGCKLIPDEIKCKLNELKITHEIQKEGHGITTLQRYMSRLMIHEYKMKNLNDGRSLEDEEDDSSSSSSVAKIIPDDGVTLNDNGAFKGILLKYGKNSNGHPLEESTMKQGRIVLPCIIDNLTLPASPFIKTLAAHPSKTS